MIWIIARRQLLDYLITWRFGLVLAFSTVLVVLGTSLQVANLEEQLADYDTRQSQTQQAASQVRTYNELRLGVGRRPPVLAFLCGGQDRDLPHFASMGVLAPPLEALGIVVGKDWYLGFGDVQSREVFTSQNPLLQGLQRLDFTFVVATFLSLLAFLLSFDSIAGERESGTLLIVIANPVSRSRLLLGKLLGGLGCLAISLAVALVAALLAGLQSPRIALGLADWLGVGLLFAVSLLLLGGLFALGLAVSARTARSSTSLVILLLVWTVLTVLIPSAVPYVASLARDVPSQLVYDRGRAAIVEALWQDLRGLSGKVPPPDNPEAARYAQGGSRISGDIPYCVSGGLLAREGVSYWVQGTETGNRMILASIDQWWRIYDRRFADLLAQRGLAEWLGRLTPISAYASLAERIAGTHPDSGVRFAQQARRFYDSFIEFAGQDGGLGLRFFTPLSADDFPSVAVLRDIMQRRQFQEFQRLYEGYLEKAKQAPPLQGLPQFRYRPAALLSVALQPDLAVLLLLPVLFYALGLSTFVHREEGGRP